MVFEASFVSAFQNELKDTHWLLEAFTLDDSDAWAHECHATIECFCVLVLIVTTHPMSATPLVSLGREH